MKQPHWKVLLSHFTDVHIESSSSPYNDILDLLLVKGSYQLCTAEAVYSFAEKYDNFYDTFEAIKLRDIKIENVLILGLGLGSIPFMIENHFDRKLKYTTVEIDSEVIYLASKYVLDELKSDIQVIEADAHLFMKALTEKYDLICMDIFQSDIIPEVFQTLDFLKLLQSTLSDTGMLLYNRLYLTEEDKLQSNLFYKNKFNAVFTNSSFINLRANKMLLSRAKT